MRLIHLPKIAELKKQDRGDHRLQSFPSMELVIGGHIDTVEIMRQFVVKRKVRAGLRR